MRRSSIEDVVPMLPLGHSVLGGMDVIAIYRSKLSEDVFVPSDVHDAFSALATSYPLKLDMLDVRMRWRCGLCCRFLGNLELV